MTINKENEFIKNAKEIRKIAQTQRSDETWNLKKFSKK